jgi:hypothetical protein
MHLRVPVRVENRGASLDTGDRCGETGVHAFGLAGNDGAEADFDQHPARRDGEWIVDRRLNKRQ